MSAEKKTSPKGHKLVPMEPESRLGYLLALEREYPLWGHVIEQLGFDAAMLHESKEDRLKLFRDTLGEPVCDEGYPLQFDVAALFRNAPSPAVMATLHVGNPFGLLERRPGAKQRAANNAEIREVKKALRQAGITKKDMS